jgi:hypothetical protein
MLALGPHLVVVSPSHGGGHRMFHRTHPCLTSGPEFAASHGGYCPLRAVVTIGRVRPTRTTGFCGGCSPSRSENSDPAGGSVLWNSAWSRGRRHMAPAVPAGGAVVTGPLIPRRAGVGDGDVL